MSSKMNLKHADERAKRLNNLAYFKWRLL